MGWFEKIFPAKEAPLAEGSRVLNVPSGRNIRELGGYETPDGPTAFHRFLRSGSTEYLSRGDIERLEAYGVSHVLDLRSSMESPERTCAFARVRGVVWHNVELYSHDISDPRLATAEREDNWLVNSYLAMLANHEAMRRIAAFCAEAPRDACVLFHCAAGMDRTGMTALVLLGLAGVDRDQIVRDYGYSFGTVEEVDRAVDRHEYVDHSPWMSLKERLEAIGTVHDALMDAYGSVRMYLVACGVADAQIDALRARLLEA